MANNLNLVAVISKADSELRSTVTFCVLDNSAVSSVSAAKVTNDCFNTRGVRSRVNSDSNRLSAVSISPMMAVRSAVEAKVPIVGSLDLAVSTTRVAELDIATSMLLVLAAVIDSVNSADRLAAVVRDLVGSRATVNSADVWLSADLMITAEAVRVTASNNAVDISSMLPMVAVNVADRLIADSASLFLDP